LVFQTVNDGRLIAYSADRGEKLLELQTGLRSGMGPPMTYQIGGRQYVALLGGVGSVAPGNAAGPGNAATPFSPKLLAFALHGAAVAAPVAGAVAGTARLGLWTLTLRTLLQPPQGRVVVRRHPCHHTVRHGHEGDRAHTMMIAPHPLGLHDRRGRDDAFQRD